MISLEKSEQTLTSLKVSSQWSNLIFLTFNQFISMNIYPPKIIEFSTFGNYFEIFEYLKFNFRTKGKI